VIYGTNSEVYAEQLAASASNIRNGANPSYQVSDFLSVYPQFGTNTQGTPNVPIAVIQLYIDLAQACIQSTRWRTSWTIAMSLFVAHFCTLWLRGSASVDDNKDTIIDAGYTEGIITGSSVDGVSYSMDITTAANDLEGYAAWKSTSYGIQLATFAKMYGKGGIMVR
jgi:hypothetical protein